MGLRDGARRPLGRRVRAQAAPEAREGLAALALHPHPLRHRLPLRGGTGRGTPGERRAVDVDAAPRRQSRSTGTPGDQRELAGTQQDTSSPPAPSRRTTARPPFFRSTRPPVSSPTMQREVGLVADQQQAAVGAETPRERVERLRARRSRPPAADAHAQAARAAARSSCLGRELGRLARAHLGADQHRLEARLPGARARRPAARAWRSPRAVSRRSAVRARAVRLGLGVT